MGSQVAPLRSLFKLQLGPRNPKILGLLSTSNELVTDGSVLRGWRLGNQNRPVEGGCRQIANRETRGYRSYRQLFFTLTLATPLIYKLFRQKKNEIIKIIIHRFDNNIAIERVSHKNSMVVDKMECRRLAMIIIRHTKVK